MVSNSKEYSKKYMSTYCKNPEKGGKIMECECGKTYKAYAKYKHVKSKYHLEHLRKEENKDYPKLEQFTMDDIVKLKKIITILENVKIDK